MKKFFVFIVVLLVSIIAQAQIKKPNQRTVITPKPERVGTVSITTTPSGCSVCIDGEYIEKKTPVSIKKPAGTYTISLELNGYKSEERSIRVIAGKTTKCNVTMDIVVLSPKDSVILACNEIITMSTNYDSATLNAEEKNIVSFQSNAVNYAKGVKDMYEQIIEKETAEKLSIDELKVIITNCVLRNQHCNNLEKPCIQTALNMFQDMGNAKSNVYQGVNMVELAKLANIVQKQAISDETTAKIVELIGQVKLTEALDIYQQGLLNPEITERYNSFLTVIKSFYVLSNMRMTEIKNN